MKNPTHINIRCYISIVFDNLGDKESALKVLSQLDQHSAFNSPVITYQLSKLYHALGMPLVIDSMIDTILIFVERRINIDAGN